MDEFEKTYLAKYLPAGLADCDQREIIDIYIPKDRRHPIMRIRKNGDKYEVTKKQQVAPGDSSHQLEQTIILDEQEFGVLSELDGKRVRKIRYSYNYRSVTAEIDVFQDELLGLVLVDFEFSGHEVKNEFPIPDFCLAEVTQEEFTAGGMLCGKTYGDIEGDLAKFNYVKITPP